MPPSVTGSASEKSASLGNGLVLVFAVACGLSVANLYYAQPILGTIARAFGTSPATTGLVVTLSQIGYAAGLALLVPLGDLVDRRRLVPIVLTATTAGLVVSAVAPSIGVLIGVALSVGAGSVAAQILVPMAASLADDERRGRVVGTVMSGLLLGILLARTVSGLVSGTSSWRVVYVMAAGLTIVMALVLSRVLPPEHQRPRIGYGSLLSTTVRLFASEAVLRRRSLFGALAFAAFSVFWTTMAFLLGGTPYHYSDITIGLFGLVGAAGALCANIAGRWADRGWTKATTIVFATCICGSFLSLWWGGRSLFLLIVGIIILDVGVQGLQVTNQSIIYRLAPEARSRVNSVYMVCYFAGGAIGSALGSALYDSHRWTGVCVLGALIGAAALAVAVGDAVGRPTGQVRSSGPVPEPPRSDPESHQALELGGHRRQVGGVGDAHQL
ncbi:MAG: MFS transporter [Acidimicrobiales bacterium]